MWAGATYPLVTDRVKLAIAAAPHVGYRRPISFQVALSDSLLHSPARIYHGGNPPASD